MKINRNAILKWICLVILAGYATWATIWAHGEASRHVCTAIDVRVEAAAPVDSIVRAGVLQELASYPGKIKGVPIDQLDTHKIGAYLNRLNMFETVKCMVSASGRLCVEVVPMVPVMRVFNGNKSFYINKDGKRIDSNAEFFSDVPVVTGNFTSRFRPVDMLPLVKFVTDDPVMHDLTAMLVGQDSHNLIVVPKITGHVVNFGDTTRLEAKRDALSLFYRKVMPYKGWEEYDTISVKYRNQIVATRRDKARLNVPEESSEEIDLEEATLPDVAGATSSSSPNTDRTASGNPNQNNTKAERSHE